MHAILYFKIFLCYHIENMVKQVSLGIQQWSNKFLWIFNSGQISFSRYPVVVKQVSLGIQQWSNKFPWVSYSGRTSFSGYSTVVKQVSLGI